MRRLLRVAPAAALLALSAPAAGQERIAVYAEAGTPVIATEVLVATGPADEEAGKEGLAHLAARAVTRPILATLDSLDAHVAVRAHKDALAFTLTAAPDAWAEAVRVLMVALFRDPVDGSAFLREQRAVHAELLARQVNPADAIGREADAAFFGPEHPWGRAAVGTPQSVERLTLADADRFLRAHFTPERALAVVVGPVEPEPAYAHLRTFLPGGRAPLAPTLPERDPEETVRRDYNSITTWVSASFPFPAGADEEAMRLLAYLVGEELAFGPTQRSVYNLRSEVVPRASGGEMRFTVVIPPEEAGAWADRIQSVVRNVAEERGLRDVWAARMRRYRGERFQALLAPEDRANEAARRLLVSGESRSLVPNLDALTVNRVRAAAISLGEPAVVFLGPFLDDQD